MNTPTHVQILWNYCNVLRGEAMNCGEAVVNQFGTA